MGCRRPDPGARHCHELTQKGLPSEGVFFQASLLDDHSKLPKEPGPDDLFGHVTFPFQDYKDVLRGPAATGFGEFESAFERGCVRDHVWYLRPRTQTTLPL
jgi:hypothetical protein